MNSLKSVLILLPVALALTACSGPMPMTYTPQFAPVTPTPRESVKLTTGAIFAADSTDMWQAKRKDYRVGDIITVLLSESTQAARTLNNETSRESSTDAVPTGMSNAKHTLTFSFMSVANSLRANDLYGFQAMTDSTKAAVRRALDYVSTVANLAFEEVDAGGDIQFGTQAQPHLLRLDAQRQRRQFVCPAKSAQHSIRHDGRPERAADLHEQAARRHARERAHRLSAVDADGVKWYGPFNWFVHVSPLCLRNNPGRSSAIWSVRLRGHSVCRPI